MTDKRFVIKPSSIVTDGFVIIDKEKKYTFPVLDSTLNYMFCKALNELHEEKEQLKKQIGNLEHTRDFADEVCADCERLEKENEQLKVYVGEMEDYLGRLEEKIERLEEKNEQLKQQEKRLYKYFQKCFDNVSEQGFQETWEVVKKYD